MEPVSIRSKNPGAMWPGPVATKFGSKEWWPCAGNNKIAVFPTFEQGAAAEFYLWATKYSDMSLAAAIRRWSGENSPAEYAKFLQKRVPGVTLNTQLTPEFFQSEDGLKFMIAQSQWEAGKPYPMTEAQFRAGQNLAFAKTVHETEDREAPKVIVPKHIPPGAEAPTKPLSRSKTFWSSIAGAAATIGGFLTDWHILAVAAVLVVFGYIVWERNGKPDIRGWFK